MPVQQIPISKIQVHPAGTSAGQGQHDARTGAQQPRGHQSQQAPVPHAAGHTQPLVAQQIPHEKQSEHAAERQQGCQRQAVHQPSSAKSQAHRGQHRRRPYRKRTSDRAPFFLGQRCRRRFCRRRTGRRQILPAIGADAPFRHRFSTTKTNHAFHTSPEKAVFLPKYSIAITSFNFNVHTG